MICIILVAGIESALELELVDHHELRGLPRGLLPVAGKPILDYWWDTLQAVREISKIYIVTNARYYKHYERWATAHGLPSHHVVNNGCTSKANLCGAAHDLYLGIRHARAEHQGKSVCVIAGDSLFYREFDLTQVVACFEQIRENGEDYSLALCYKLNQSSHESPERRGMVNINPKTGVMVDFLEKPGRETWKTLALEDYLACPLFYMLSPAAVQGVRMFLQECNGEMKSCGDFLAWAHKDYKFVCMRLPGGFDLVGVSAGLEEYKRLNETYRNGSISTWMRLKSKSSTSLTGASTKQDPMIECEETHSRAYARVGLMGNPSDGFFGKTISFTIKNFYAEVFLYPSEKLCLQPHPLFDPSEFGSLGDLHRISKSEGYHGGMRLLMGTSKKFFEYCVERKLALPKKNFTVKYDTNIPRQVGLAGSSAIITAFFKALMKFYGLTDDDISKQHQANFVLSVEVEEMGINAGLQDRVVQVYQGLVYMDFSKHLLETNGYGEYKVMNSRLLPENLFFLAYSSKPSDSGTIHSNVKQRWLAGDEQVIEYMHQFAQCAMDAKGAIETRDYDKLRELMNKNFDLRATLYGDEVIGASNLEMINIARRMGCASKFPGSGGAIVGLAPNRDLFIAAREEFINSGFVFVPIEFTD